jgi:hypothetical protein
MVDFIIFLIEFLYVDIKKSDAFAGGYLSAREGLACRLVQDDAGKNKTGCPHYVDNLRFSILGSVVNTHKLRASR